MNQNSEKTTLKGGEFVIKETCYRDIFIPEEFDEESQMIRQTCADFLKTEVLGHLDRIDSQEERLMECYVDKAGDLGLLGVSELEQYGGLSKDFNTTMIVAHALGGGYSFVLALSAHTGIATLSILYYGSDEQKENYIPKLATAE